MRSLAKRKLSVLQSHYVDTTGPRGAHLLLPQPSPPPPAAAAAGLLLLLGTAALLFSALLLLLYGLREGRVLVGCLAAVFVRGWGVRVLCYGCCGAEDAAPCKHSTAQHSTPQHDTQWHKTAPCRSHGTRCTQQRKVIPRTRWPSRPPPPCIAPNPLRICTHAHAAQVRPAIQNPPWMPGQNSLTARTLRL
jgi:hypothetical protein